MTKINFKYSARKEAMEMLIELSKLKDKNNKNYFSLEELKELDERKLINELDKMMDGTKNIIEMSHE